MAPLTGPSALSGQDSLALSLQLSLEETPALMGRTAKQEGALAGGCAGAAGSAGRGHPTPPGEWGRLSPWREGEGEAMAAETSA